MQLEERKQIADNSIHNRLTKCPKGQYIYILQCALHILNFKNKPEIVVFLGKNKAKNKYQF